MTGIHLEFGIRPLRGREVDRERRHAFRETEATECVRACPGWRPLAERPGQLLQEIDSTRGDVAGPWVTDVVEVEEATGHVFLGIDPGVLLVVPVVTFGTGEIVCESEVVVVVDPVARGLEIEPGAGILGADERVADGLVGVAPAGVPGDLSVVAVLPEQLAGAMFGEIGEEGVRPDAVEVDLRIVLPTVSGSVCVREFLRLRRRRCRGRRVLSGFGLIGVRVSGVHVPSLDVVIAERTSANSGRGFLLARRYRALLICGDDSPHATTPDRRYRHCESFYRKYLTKIQVILGRDLNSGFALVPSSVKITPVVIRPN